MIPLIQKFLLSFTLVLLYASTVLPLNQPIYGATDCPGGDIVTDPPQPWNTSMSSSSSITITIGGGTLDPGQEYNLYLDGSSLTSDSSPKATGAGAITVTFTAIGTIQDLTKEGEHTLTIKTTPDWTEGIKYICEEKYPVVPFETLTCSVFEKFRDIGNCGDPATFKGSSYSPGDNVGVCGLFQFVNIFGGTTPRPHDNEKVDLWLMDGDEQKDSKNAQTNAGGYYENNFLTIPAGVASPKWWQISAGDEGKKLCSFSSICVSPIGGGPCAGSPPPVPVPGPTTTGKNPCKSGICKTAFGNIPVGELGDFVTKVLRIAVALAGGIALIIMVIGAVRVLTSSGDQQKLAGGRDMIVAAIAGLLFLIFSVTILRIIGFDILGLNPEFAPIL